ncbi:hypothetical protein BsWGS_24138 [Bradybaena similaris]
MGDFYASKKKDVDKFNKRIALYRHHHSTTAARYLLARQGIYEQQEQDTLLLRQRYSEVKVKKLKQSKAISDSKLLSDHKNLFATKMKRKINCSNISGSGGKENKRGSSFSVQIVQKISSHPQDDPSQTIHTDVTVSSHFDTNSPQSGNPSVHTNVQCKQEPSEGNDRSSGLGPSSTIHNTLIDLTSVDDTSSVDDICVGIGDDDALQSILDSLEKVIEPSLLKDLNEFDEIYEKIRRDSKITESASMYAPQACASPGLSKEVFPSFGSNAQLVSMFDGIQNISSATVTNHATRVPPLPEPTGPAAETLKQMAAQQHSPEYPLKGVGHFTDRLQNGRYSPLYLSVPNKSSVFPYSHVTNYHTGDKSHMTSDMAPAMGFGSTKPLAHFSNDQGQHRSSPSSLQQLQNQELIHVKPASPAPHRLQIMQSQNVQISHGTQNVQMSQTQQLQMQPLAQQISLSQQQTFNMGQQQMVSEQMKMQMIEKMRMKQQQQAQQGRMSPQCMAQAPPEYKMHQGARQQGSCAGTSVLNDNQQTVQNMLSQTAVYGTMTRNIASPPCSGHSSSGLSSQFSAMQHQTMSATIPSSGSHQTMSATIPSYESHLQRSPQQISQPQQPAFRVSQQQMVSEQMKMQMMEKMRMEHLQAQSIQVRPGFYSQKHIPQAPAYSVVDSSLCAQSSSSYASTTLRNQRSPSVNVIPEGLDISLQSSQRTSNFQSELTGIRRGSPSSSPGFHGTVQSAPMAGHFMQYQQQHMSPHGYGAGSNTGTRAATYMTQMQQQQFGPDDSSKGWQHFSS